MNRPSIIRPLATALLSSGAVFFALACLNPPLSAAELPRGFFIMDLSSSSATPAFYNLETHRLQPFPLRQSYRQFIDMDWDRDHGRVFFSAQRKESEPFRIFLKDWPDGEEKPIYENPLGPFRFLRSPDGERLALQIMGPSAWPTIGVFEVTSGRLTALGQGYSPDWSKDGQRLLFLKIPGSLPSYLMEYRVETDTATQLRPEPVMEAVYTDDPEQIILKTADHARRCDMFQVWNRHTGQFGDFCRPEYWTPRKKCTSEREITVFPGHQFMFFKESPDLPDAAVQSLVVCDVFGGRLQTLSHDDWAPTASPVDDTTLLLGEDPLYLTSADGAGGRTEIPQAGFIRARR